MTRSLRPFRPLAALAALTVTLACASVHADDAKKAPPPSTPTQATTSAGAPRSPYRFAVQEFRVADSVYYPGWNGYQTGLNNAVCDMLTTEMSQAGWDMVEREQLDKLLKEQDLGAGGRLDPSTAAPIGKILGADYLIIGTITEWGMKERGIGGSGLLGGGIFGGARLSETTARVKIDFHIVNAKTSRIVKGSAWTVQGEDTNRGVSLQKNWYNNINFSESEWTSSQIGKATRKAVQQIAEKMSGWTPNDGGAEPDRPAIKAGIVALISPTEFVIDKGQADDVRVGDTMDVVSLKAIKNAEGKLVYQTETRVGSAKVVEVQANGAKLRITSQEPDAPKIKEGDGVHTPAPATLGH